MKYRKLLDAYRKMYLIRAFELMLLDLFAEGKLSGTTHTYQGQEAIAVAAMDHINEKDSVFSNHRCHGHYIAYGGDVEKLLAEIMGKSGGVCGGRGGSQHLCWKNFYTNGIQGGMLPCAAGYALASQLQGEASLAVAFIGDGTLGEGIVYETLNIASLRNIPLLIIVEDNGYAQTTPKAMHCAGDMAARFSAFNIKTLEIKSNDVTELHQFFEKSFGYVREHHKPCCCIVHTYRLGPHSKGDDFRDPLEIAEWRKQDPVALCAEKLRPDDALFIQSEVADYLNACATRADQGTVETLETICKGISTFYRTAKPKDAMAETGECRYFESLNRSLHKLFSEHQETLVIGEDILDPYGGSFKVTKGLSTIYPERTISTPISEAGFSGIANGLALNHMRPIVEVMFADFSTLILDQVLNHGAKFKWMYHNKVNTPVIFRLPTGGKRGYGPTHSQSPERIFFGLPNVTVVAPSHYHDPGKLLHDLCLSADTPVIFVEDKGLYTEQLVPIIDGRAGNFYCTRRGGLLPTLRLCPEAGSAEYTIVCYGGGLKTALTVSWEMMIEEEVNVEVICPSLISPIPDEDILSLISDASKRVLILDESFSHFGWASELALQVCQNDRLHSRNRDIVPIGAMNTYISTCKQVELQTLVSANRLKTELMKEIR